MGLTYAVYKIQRIIRLDGITDGFRALAYDPSIYRNVCTAGPLLSATSDQCIEVYKDEAFSRIGCTIHAFRKAVTRNGRNRFKRPSCDVT